MPASSGALGGEAMRQLTNLVGSFLFAIVLYAVIFPRETAEYFAGIVNAYEAARTPVLPVKAEADAH